MSGEPTTPTTTEPSLEEQLAAAQQQLAAALEQVNDLQADLATTNEENTGLYEIIAQLRSQNPMQAFVAYLLAAIGEDAFSRGAIELHTNSFEANSPKRTRSTVFSCPTGEIKLAQADDTLFLEIEERERTYSIAIKKNSPAIRFNRAPRVHTSMSGMRNGVPMDDEDLAATLEALGLGDLEGLGGRIRVSMFGGRLG